MHNLSTIDDDVAAERGRLYTALVLANDTEQRRVAEDRLGKEYCRRRYPEAYSKAPFFKSILDKIRFVG